MKKLVLGLTLALVSSTSMASVCMVSSANGGNFNDGRGRVTITCNRGNADTQTIIAKGEARAVRGAGLAWWAWIDCCHGCAARDGPMWPPRSRWPSSPGASGRGRGERAPHRHYRELRNDTSHVFL